MMFQDIFRPFISLLMPKLLSIVPLAAAAAPAVLGTIGATGAAGGVAAAGGSAIGGGFFSSLLANAAGKTAGTKALSALGGAQGAISGIKSLIQGGKAEQAFPAFRDPKIDEQLNEIKARRRAFQSGSAFEPAFQRAAESTAGSLSAARTRARNLGELLTAGGRIEKARQGAFSQLFTRGQELDTQLLTQVQIPLEQRQSQRELDLRLLQNREAEARSQQSQASSRDTVNNALIRLFSDNPPGGAGIAQTGTPGTPSVLGGTIDQFLRQQQSPIGAEDVQLPLGSV